MTKDELRDEIRRLRGLKTPWRRGPSDCRCGAWGSCECACGLYGTGELLSLADNPYVEPDMDATQVNDAAEVRVVDLAAALRASLESAKARRAERGNA